MSERRTVVKNAAFLAVSQYGGYLVPFLTLPYLARVLDQETFGAWQYCLVFMGFSTAIVDFGFSSYGVRLVASRSLSAIDLRRLVSQSIGTKIIIYIGSVLVAFAISMWVPLASRYSAFFILNAVSQFFLVFYPGFLFQGLERMEFSAVFNLITHLVKFAAIFVFIRKPTDYMALAYMNLANATVLSVGGLIASRSVIQNVRDPEQAQKGPSLRIIIRDCSIFSATKLATTLVGSASSFVLGTFGGGQGLAQYSIGDKVVGLSKELYSPVLNALFPFLSRKAAAQDGSIQDARRLLKVPVLSLATLGSLALLTSAPLLVHIVAGEGYNASIHILRILSFKFFAGVIGDFLFMQFAYPLGLERNMLLIFTSGGLASIGFSALGYFLGGGLGLAWASIASELFVHICTAVLVVKTLRSRSNETAISKEKQIRSTAGV